MKTLIKIAKAIVHEGFETQAFTRDDFYQAIKKIAKDARKDNETPQQAFSRAVTEHEDARILMAAMSLSVDGPLRKSAPQTGRPDVVAGINPGIVDGNAAFANVDDAEGLLHQLAAKLQAANPGSMTKEAAFARVYEENTALAMAERAQRMARLTPLQAYDKPKTI